MKKIFISIIVLLMTISIYQVSFAVKGQSSIPLNFTGANKISQDTKNITFTVSLGEFTEIPQNPIIGYEAILEYDKNIFSSVTVEGLNNWKADYAEGTGRLLGETLTIGEANKEITKITLTLKDGVEPGTTTVKLKSVLLTVNDDLDFNYEKEATLTIEKKAEEEQPKEDKNEVPAQNTTEEDKTKDESKDKTEKEQETDNSKKSNNTQVKANEDKTTSTKKLPATGMGKVAMIVTVVAIIGIGCLIKYKSIEIK